LSHLHRLCRIVYFEHHNMERRRKKNFFFHKATTIFGLNVEVPWNWATVKRICFVGQSWNKAFLQKVLFAQKVTHWWILSWLFFWLKQRNGYRRRKAVKERHGNYRELARACCNTKHSRQF
jgi:hypothetical protein